jgi:hypothetical protein
MRGDDTLWRPGRQQVSGEHMPTTMTPPDRASIEHFVRSTLGCGCPDEVFQHLVVSRLPPIAGRPPIVQLQVGSRLLIHVVAPPDGATANGWIEQLAYCARPPWLQPVQAGDRIADNARFDRRDPGALRARDHR